MSPDPVPARRLTATVAALGLAPPGTFETRPTGHLLLDFGGIAGDAHHGPTRRAGGREPWYPRGLAIANARHVSLVDADEIAEIARRLDVAGIDPGWIGANIVVAGVPDFSWLPRGTRLAFPSGATLVVTDQNAPCRKSGRAVAARYSERKGLDTAFARYGSGLRGLVARVEASGPVETGDTIGVEVPAQWIWTGPDGIKPPPSPRPPR